MPPTWCLHTGYSVSFCSPLLAEDNCRGLCGKARSLWTAFVLNNAGFLFNFLVVSCHTQVCVLVFGVSFRSGLSRRFLFVVCLSSASGVLLSVCVSSASGVLLSPRWTCHTVNTPIDVTDIYRCVYRAHCVSCVSIVFHACIMFTRASSWRHRFGFFAIAREFVFVSNCEQVGRPFYTFPILFLNNRWTPWLGK